MSSFRYELDSRAQLEEQVRIPLPLGIASTPARRTFHRDIFLDTPDDSLRKRGIVCRLRIDAHDRRTLSVRGIAGSDAERDGVESAIADGELGQALRENTPAVARLSGIV